MCGGAQHDSDNNKKESSQKKTHKPTVCQTRSVFLSFCFKYTCKRTFFFDHFDSVFSTNKSTSITKSVNFLLNLIFPNNVVNNKMVFNRKSFYDNLNSQHPNPMRYTSYYILNAAKSRAHLFDCVFMQISCVNNTNRIAHRPKT